MKPLNIKIYLNCIALFFFIICIFNLNVKTPKCNQLYSNCSNTARMRFLNNTFCGKFISGTWNRTIHKDEIKQRQKFLQNQNKHSNIHYDNISCSKFIIKNGFYSKYITDHERANPMAFGILVYKHFYQFQVLMRTLYVRTNIHCIHVDRKASSQIYAYALKLSKCLENVHIVKTRINVQWGDISILEAQSLCQRILLNQSSAWHYYMTVAGTELPIQTNLNRLQILQLIPDKSCVDVVSFPYSSKRQASKKTSPPGNMTIYKGELHAILTRHFVEAVHNDPLALQLYAYLNGTGVPDEHYYSSLVHLDDFPGTKARIVPIYKSGEMLSHYKIWTDAVIGVCRSKRFLRAVCQFDYKDLADIEKSGRLFANKFNEEYDLISIDCWEQWFKMKEKYHQDIDPQKYIDRYPFTQRTVHN